MPTTLAESSMTPPSHDKLAAWVEQVAQLTQPDDVYWCDGSDDQYQQMIDRLVASGSAVKLNEKKKPNSILVRSDPADVARVEDRTFICSEKEEDAGPTNNWADPGQMKTKIKGLFAGCMRGRTMYVVPFSMGPVGSDISHIGVEISDSPYVVANMMIMTRVGKPVLDVLGSDGYFVPCVHSVGYPLITASGKKRPDISWPCDADNKYITHFPETREIWSYGSGYGGNALLGKKCFALRIASVMARDQGWMAEHMLILKLTSPEGKVKHIAGAFPSACGKTNLAMLKPTLPGWKVETVGDDIAWLKFNDQGELRAINPEAGFFGVAPGTNYKTNPNAMESMKKNAIFTNVGETPDGDVWWEDIDRPAPDHLIDWLGHEWVHYDSTHKAAHPNARFTAPASQCPVIADNWEDPDGVKIDAILFGGRRSTGQPLVLESFSWEHGTFLGSTMASQKTAAAAGKVGELRFDPMAMLPFCGYHMGDYFQHWLDMGRKGGSNMPRIFYVNWFRQGDDGHWLWPGFGDNIRVLKWVCERCDTDVTSTDDATQSPIGYLPTSDALDLTGLKIPEEDLAELLNIDREHWLQKIPVFRKHFAQFGGKLPKQLSKQLDELEARLNDSN